MQEALLSPQALAPSADSEEQASFSILASPPPPTDPQTHPEEAGFVAVEVEPPPRCSERVPRG